MIASSILDSLLLVNGTNAHVNIYGTKIGIDAKDPLNTFISFKPIHLAIFELTICWL